MLANVIYLQLARQMTEGNAAAQAAAALCGARGTSQSLAEVEQFGARSESAALLDALQRHLIACRKAKSASAQDFEALYSGIRVVYDSRRKDPGQSNLALTNGAFVAMTWVPCKCHWRIRVAARLAVEALQLPAAGGASAVEPSEGAGLGEGDCVLSPAPPADAAVFNIPTATAVDAPGNLSETDNGGDTTLAVSCAAGKALACLGGPHGGLSTNYAVLWQVRTRARKLRSLQPRTRTTKYVLDD